MQIKECSHANPVFGCRACVLKDKRAVLEKLKLTNPVPLCQECGKPMAFCDYNEVTMTLSYACIIGGWTEDGTPYCEGEADVKV